MATPSVSTAMDLEPRGGSTRALGLIGAVCALCGLALWAVEGGPGPEAIAAPQVFYVAPGALRAPTVPVQPAPPAVTEEIPARGGAPSMMGPIKIKALEQLELNENLDTVVRSDSMCTRRHAMTRAAGLAAGLALTAVNQPSFAAQTKMVKMGSDSGQLVFQPDEVKICKGDTVTWVNNKGGPHNVVFDEEAVPSGFNTAGYSMEDQLGDEGATYSKKFDTPGTYEYYCEPHVGGGMKGTLIVE